MANLRFWVWSGAAAVLAGAVSAAAGAVGAGEPQVAGVELPASRTIETSADVQLRFIQEDGPDSGHVRVELTPETRPLNAFEARSAAQQAFLEALNEPGLGDALKRITVVVQLKPTSGTGAAGAVQTFLFVSSGGRDWQVSSED